MPPGKFWGRVPSRGSGLLAKRLVLSLRRPEIPIWATRRSISADTSAFPVWASLDFTVANAPSYLAGTGKVAIFRSMPANSRRVRWLSASSNQ